MKNTALRAGNNPVPASAADPAGKNAKTSGKPENTGSAASPQRPRGKAPVR